jgi:hypothetical protein
MLSSLPIHTDGMKKNARNKKREKLNIARQKSNEKSVTKRLHVSGVCIATIAQKRKPTRNNVKEKTTMKKILTVCVSALVGIMLMTGCNKQVVDLTYSYSYAQLRMPDGTIVEGKLNSWDDYEGDQLQVKIDGVTYLVHSSNVVLRHLSE